MKNMAGTIWSGPVRAIQKRQSRSFAWIDFESVSMRSRSTRASTELLESPCYKKRMNKKDGLKSLSDDELLVRLSNVLKQSRRVESVLVAHIAEVDARRLYAREASSSMHKYCTDVLHLSEAEAYLRIAAARASRRHPALLTMLDDGRLHLSGIAVLAPHLTNTNCEELLARSTHKTKRELLVVVAEIAPKPDVSPSIRKLPKQRQKNGQEPPKKNRPEPASEHGTSGAESTPSGKSSPAPEPAPAPEAADKPAVVEPLAPARYKVQFTASAEFRDKIERLSALMPGVELAAMMEAAVTEKLDRLEAKRFGKVKNPRKSIEDVDTSPGVRGIPAPVRRFVWERDHGQCTFESGGDRSAENVRLLCRAHNLYMAEMDYGKDKMEQYRRSADRVREPGPSFPLFPDRVQESPPLRVAVQLATKHGPHHETFSSSRQPPPRGCFFSRPRSGRESRATTLRAF